MERIKRELPFAEVSTIRDRIERVIIDVPPDKLLDALRYVKEQLGGTHLTTITGMDDGKESIILMYHILLERGAEKLKYGYVTVRTKVPRDKPVIASSVPVYGEMAALYEREVYDLLGVKFEGHPDLRRLLLPETLPEGYHPLRKDFKGPTFEEEVTKSAGR